MKRTVESHHSKLKLSISTMSAQLFTIIEALAQQHSSKKQRSSSPTQKLANPLLSRNLTVPSQALASYDKDMEGAE